MTPVNGNPFSVVVPKGCAPGTFINVAVPTASQVAPNAVISAESDETTCRVTMSKTVMGAAVAGGIVGGILLGTVGGIVLAGAAGYVASRPRNDRLSTTMRRVGDATVKGIADSSRWVADKMSQHSTDVVRTTRSSDNH